MVIENSTSAVTSNYAIIDILTKFTFNKKLGTIFALPKMI